MTYTPLEYLSELMCLLQAFEGLAWVLPTIDQGQQIMRKQIRMVY